MTTAAHTPAGALIFVRDSTEYGVSMPLYRQRTQGKNKAFVLADSNDAVRYAAENNLALVDRAEEPA